MTGYEPKSHAAVKVDRWTLTPELARFILATYPKVDGPRAQARFTRHHAGRGTKSSNWDAEFLNWVEQDNEKIGEHREGGTDYKGIPHDSADDWKNFLMGQPQTGATE